MEGEDVWEWRKLATLSAAHTGQACLCLTGLLVLSPMAHDGDKLSTVMVTEG